MKARTKKNRRRNPVLKLTRDQVKQLVRDHMLITIGRLIERMSAQ